MGIYTRLLDEIVISARLNGAKQAKYSARSVAFCCCYLFGEKERRENC